MSYQIGHLEYPKKDDPEIGSFREAIKQAQDNSIDDNIWAVWTSQAEGSELMAIIYGGEVFEK
jgi:hypothetical protein